MAQFEPPDTGCNLCGAAEKTLLFPRQKPVAAGQGIVRCKACGLVYRDVEKLTSPEVDYYDGKEYSAASAQWVEGRKKVYRLYLSLLENLRQTNRVLDVGCGPGFFLSAMKDRGWEVNGIEPSSSARRYASREFGLELEDGTLDSAGYGKGVFDAVTFWNVLDHLPDPKSALLKAGRLLRPGGTVIIRCPNASFHVRARRIFQSLGRVFPGFSALDPSVFHYYAFDNRSISRLLNETGFEDVSFEPAALSWTVSPETKPSYKRKILARAVEDWARLLFAVSGKRVLVSPSLMATAIRKKESRPRG